ncbi:FkbM family methyltransferase [Aurantimonas sp. 22II-16-19i]|uniref:FkbM family methyltransferase n=1 Tax=Aurantimonas sp. 22II-16-19i TaxID=1317114 RepID=UPI002478273B|nr:FkbM family methyltransferase [Aurantimonas sp. 22II-16-19i]
MFSANDDVVAWQFFWGGRDSYESEIIAKWAEWAKSAQSVLDIGAYTGLMSIIAAMVNPDCEIHAMEPIPQTAERARINLRANQVERQVTIHNRAAANESGPEMINLYRGGDVLGAGNSIHDKGGKKIFNRQMIQTVNVDQYLGHKRFDLIKVDVEGFETHTLMGLRRIMKRDRPKLVLELWKENEADVFRLLDTLEYRYQPVEREPVRVMNYFCEPME